MFFNFRDKFSRKEFSLLDIGDICKYVLESISVCLRLVFLLEICMWEHTDQSELTALSIASVPSDGLWKSLENMSLISVLLATLWAILPDSASSCSVSSICIFSTHSFRSVHTYCFTLLIVLVFGERAYINFYSLVGLVFKILTPDTYASIRAPHM